MNHRKVIVLLLLLATMGLGVRAALALCNEEEPNPCPEGQQCINAHCVTPPVDPPTQSCIPSGGIDDVLYRTHCCSGQSVPGSIYCINPADINNGWASCVQICA